MSKITVKPIHQPDEGPNPVNCSSCLCTQLICRCKYSQIFVQGFWYMLLSRQGYPFQCVLPFKNHSGPQRLALLASKLVFVATTRSRWPAAALYCSAGPSSETWIWATSCREAQSLIFPISALLYGSFCEDKGAVKSLRCSCCASSWQLTLAFCCFLRSWGGASHSVSNPPVSQVVVAMNLPFAKRKVLSVETYGYQHKLRQKKSGKEQVLVLHTNFFFPFLLFRETLYSWSSAVFDQ